jgi:carnitine O-palmitoyltransferase 2
MGGSKYNRLLGNKFVAKYKNSLAFLSSSKKASPKEQYNFLQQSIIPTQHFQKSLTKLQIPKLDETINRYLKALRPILTEDEWKQAEKVTRQFEKNEAIGKFKYMQNLTIRHQFSCLNRYPFLELDRQVRELDKKDKDGNYISEPWFDMYLRDRASIFLNYNPFIVFAKDPNPSQRDQVFISFTFLIVKTFL